MLKLQGQPIGGESGGLNEILNKFLFLNDAHSILSTLQPKEFMPIRLMRSNIVPGSSKRQWSNGHLMGKFEL